MRGRRRAVFALALTTAVVVSISVSAHRRDEYLQAARVAVEPGRVDLELDLTPGIAVAEAAIAAIDRDRDGVLSADEKRAYAGRALDAVALELDGRPLHVESVSSTFPGLDDLRHGEGTIRLQAAVVLSQQADGDHQLSFRNRDQRDGSVYLANAMVPKSERVTITAQRRDPAQRELTIDYGLRGGPATAGSTWLLSGLTLLVTALASLLIRSKNWASV